MVRAAFAVVVLVAACSGAAGWSGSDVHRVGGVWIGFERECAAGDAGLECRTLVNAALKTLPADQQPKVARAVVAELPTTFVTPDGEVRTARLTVGIATRKAVVIDLIDGARRVIGLWCSLPYTSDGGLIARDVRCSADSLEYWRDGNAPPSYPPGTVFG